MEIVEIDEARIAKLRGQVSVDVPVDLQWAWNYSSEVEELRALYENGKRSQWDAEAEIDWSQPFPKNEWFLPKEGVQVLPIIMAKMGKSEDDCREASFAEFAWNFSQLLHGEQGALQICGQLTN